MIDGISNRAAARLIGCTHRAIGQAIEHGHLSTLPSGKIDPAALEKWNAGRRSARGGIKRITPASVSTRQTAQCDAPKVPGPVVGLTATAECCASDVVLALLPHLPETTTQAIYGSLLTEWRAAAAELADDDFAPPAGLASWAEHPLFTDPVALDWQELRELANQGAIGGAR